MCQCTLRPLLLSRLLVRRKLLVEQRSLRQLMATHRLKSLHTGCTKRIQPSDCLEIWYADPSSSRKMVSIWTWHIPSRWARCSVPSRLSPKCWAKLKCLPNSVKIIQFKLSNSYGAAPGCDSVLHMPSPWINLTTMPLTDRMLRVGRWDHKTWAVERCHSVISMKSSLQIPTKGQMHSWSQAEKRSSVANFGAAGAAENRLPP